MIIKLLIMFALFCALLYLLNKLMPDFQIETGAIPIAALVLVGVDFVITWIFGGTGTALNWMTLGIFGLIQKIINFFTLGLFSLLIGFLLNVIIFWLADKLTDRLTIKSTKTLLVSAAALQFTNYLLDKLL